jgi:ribonuclease HI
VTRSREGELIADLIDLMAGGKGIEEAAREMGMSAARAQAMLHGLSDRLRGRGRQEVVLCVDGASRGNPGPAGIGVVVQTPSGEIIRELGMAIGEATSNVAEYEALILGLREAKSLGADSVSIQTDSQLLHHQLRGQYRVKDEKLVPRFRRVHDLLEEFTTWRITHVPREKNRVADRLANMAIDKGKRTK